MAIYFASPFGTIIGKVNGQIGKRWRGKNVITKYTIPTDRGPLLQYQQMKDGLIPPDRFSFPQFNLRRLVVNPLMHMGRHNPDFIAKIWKTEVEARHLNISGLNLFCKSNITQLYASFDKTLEFDPITNSPDITKLIIATGILEGTSELTATYDTATGNVVFTWNPEHYANGADTDYAFFVVVKKPLLESYGRWGNWQPALAMYYFAFPAPPALPTSRVEGTSTRTIDPGLDAANLTAFAFFLTTAQDPRLISISASSVVTTPP